MISVSRNHFLDSLRGIAAQLSHALRLPMSDSIILATARAHQSFLHTMDSDFQGLPDVVLIDKGT